MSEKKNIVIKVKYPSNDDKSYSSSGSGGNTLWDFKKIGLVFGSLLLLMILFFYFTGDGEEQTTTVTTASQQAAVSEPSAGQSIQNQNPVPPVSAPVEVKTVVNSKAVTRSQLTSDINKNEPIDNLKVPLKIGKKETLWIYYFVELKGMNKQVVYHEWWLNGSLVSRKKVNVSDDPWRTASKQLITYTKNNDWVVKVVDESRNTLSEKTFNLDIE